MGSAESPQASSEPTAKYDQSFAAIVIDGLVSKQSVALEGQHTADESSNPAVVTDSSRQATVMCSTLVNLVHITYCRCNLFHLPYHHMTAPYEL